MSGSCWFEDFWMENFQMILVIRDVKEFNEENFDFVKSLIPGFNTGDVSDRWYHVPTEWERGSKETDL